MVEAVELKIMAASHIQWLDFPAEFHENLSIVQRLFWGDRRTDIETGNLISPPFIFKEKRLKTENRKCCNE
jgi:hypothetical protein